jgi:hypothetical protein
MTRRQFPVAPQNFAILDVVGKQSKNTSYCFRLFFVEGVLDFRAFEPQKSEGSARLFWTRSQLLGDLCGA